jgi:4-hydroxy-tetrahydrodipicolinate synthase
MVPPESNSRGQRTWAGVYVPIVSPFDKNGSLDVDALARNVNEQIDAGIDGICVAGSTGEWFSFDEGERCQLFEVVVRTVAGRVACIAGTASVNVPETVRLARHAAELGYDAQLLLPPPYILPNDNEVVRYYETVAGETELPIILYNNPGRTGVHLTADLVIKLSEIPSVVALKDSGSDVVQAAFALRQVASRISYLAGFEPLATALLSRGAAGLVSNLANIDPRPAVNLWESWQRREVGGVQAAQKQLDDLYAISYCSGVSPYPAIKMAMSLLGRAGGFPRPPLLPLTERETDHLARQVKAYREPSINASATRSTSSGSCEEG